MKKILTFILFLFFILLPEQSFAAVISMHSVSSVNVGDSLKVVIKIDTEGEPINSIDISILYPKNLVSFEGYRGSENLVNMWIEAPHAENGEVKMTGIIPGGASGLYDVNKTGLGTLPLVTLIFKATKEGSAQFSFTKSLILKNDGLGTELNHTENKLEFVIKNDSKENKVVIPNEYLVVSDARDLIPPNPFAITLIHSELLSNTPDMLMFQTSDNESGVKFYKMKIGNGGWKDTQSPQAISRSVFPREISIRAYDFNDNVQEANITVSGYVPFIYALYVCLILIICGILGFKLLK